MKTAVIVINFGEPEEPTLESVVPFLERIFLQNSGLEGDPSTDARRARARELAEARAPGLVEEYRAIGGSPLNAQARAQSGALESVLRERGLDATCYPAFQFLDPSIAQAVEMARADGADVVVGLPVYPLCGHSTTVAALDELKRSVGALDWDPDVLGVSGWHGHPDYLAFHADHVRSYASAAGVDLGAPGTKLLFSIHGTPLKYLFGGNRYDRYVEEACSGIADRLGVPDYAMGYQNHSNRPIDWTQPDVEWVVEQLDADDLVVVAVSFMHEQSETLAELDHELRDVAEGRGMRFHRVPIPHDDPRFVALLADLVEGRTGRHVDGLDWRRCICADGAHCTNGMRLDTLSVPSPARMTG